MDFKAKFAQVKEVVVANKAVIIEKSVMIAGAALGALIAGIVSNAISPDEDSVIVDAPARTEEEVEGL